MEKKEQACKKYMAFCLASYKELSTRFLFSSIFLIEVQNTASKTYTNIYNAFDGFSFCKKIFSISIFNGSQVLLFVDKMLNEIEVNLRHSIKKGGIISIIGCRHTSSASILKEPKEGNLGCQ